MTHAVRGLNRAWYALVRGNPGCIHLRVSYVDMDHSGHGSYRCLLLLYEYSIKHNGHVVSATTIESHLYRAQTN